MRLCGNGLKDRRQKMVFLFLLTSSKDEIKIAEEKRLCQHIGSGCELTEGHYGPGVAHLSLLDCVVNH